jgi:hypothetical protein
MDDRLDRSSFSGVATRLGPAGKDVDLGRLNAVVDLFLTRRIAKALSTLRIGTAG